jgi:hypothetical protein
LRQNGYFIATNNKIDERRDAYCLAAKKGNVIRSRRTKEKNGFARTGIKRNSDEPSSV